MLSLPLFRRVHDLGALDRVRRNISLSAVDRDQRQQEREYDFACGHVGEKEQIGRAHV